MICGVNSYSRGRRESVPGGCGRDVLSRTPPRTRIRTAAHRINVLVFVRATQNGPLVGTGARPLAQHQRRAPVPEPWRGDRRSWFGVSKALPRAANDVRSRQSVGRLCVFICSRRARQDVAPEPGAPGTRIELTGGLRAAERSRSMAAARDLRRPRTDEYAQTFDPALCPCIDGRAQHFIRTTKS